jgi:hypothetical protein
MATPLPIPPSGIPVINVITGAMDTQWQNYFLQLSIAITTIGAAPIDAAYWTSKLDLTLTQQVDMGLLPTGVLYQTSAAGVSTPHTEPQLSPVRGGTGTDMSATGGANEVLQQLTLGGAVTVATFAASQLSDYTATTWTPTDGSGAGLALTVNSATYVKIGSLVSVQADITYPVTVNGSNARIAGLPFSSIAALWPLATAGNLTIAFDAVVNASATTFDFFNVSGAHIINSALSTLNVKVNGAYRT